MHQNFQLAYKIVKDEHKKINKKDKRKDKEGVNYNNRHAKLTRKTIHATELADLMGNGASSLLLDIYYISIFTLENGLNEECLN
ncbi:hypothetical protein PS6_000982 [Mucor atramentarius]